MTALDRHYAALADKEEGRDHDVRNAYRDRLTLSEGAFGRAWMKFNPGVQLVYVDDAEGHPRALTPKQYAVLTYALDALRSNVNPGTMRDIARALEVAPSTISRALTKLAAWGLIAYICARGRFAGLVIFQRSQNDGMDRFRKAAKARVQRWSEAARRRISRLEFNVASYILEGGRGYDSLTSYALTTDTYKDATLTAQRSVTQPWTVEELRDAGII